MTTSRDDENARFIGPGDPRCQEIQPRRIEIRADRYSCRGNQLPKWATLGMSQLYVVSPVPK